MPAFEWVHVQLHQQKGMISLSPPTICNSAQWLHTAPGLRLRYKSSRMMNSFLYDFDVICLLQHHGVAITSDEPVGYSVPIPTRNVFEAVPLQHGYVIWLLQT
ncbi:Aldehyde dehydrogenase (plasmid) [Escherichia coli]|nr:Aldehyde dehydrogenase [Escherichia coli]